MSKVYILVADGFEEIEGLTVVDLLRRARIDIKMVSITDTLKVVTSHNIEIRADILLSDIMDETELADMLVLPGGMKGTNNLKASSDVDSIIKKYQAAGKYLAAICAAPTVYGEKGLLEGKKATCSPGFQKYLTGAEYTGELFQEDGNIITGEGPAATLPYAYQILSYFIGETAVKELQVKMQYAHLMSK